MNHLRSQSGQSLIETMIAIGIVVTGLVGALSLINFTIRSTTTTENRLIAQNLAWEGVEVMVNLRDSNYLAGESFDQGITGSGNQGILTFDPATMAWDFDTSVNDINNPSAFFVEQNGLYLQSSTQIGGDQTRFSRLITLIDPQVANVTIRSVVQWEERGSTKSVSAERVLWDWR